MIVITQKSYSVYNEFIYVALVPASDYYSESAYIRNSFIISIAVGFLFSLILAYLMSSKIYKPVKRIIRDITQGNSPSDKSINVDDEFEYISNYMESMIDSNQKLSRELSMVVPLACERYMINILNDSGLNMDDSFDSIMLNYGIKFKYSFFSVAVTSLSYTSKFYDNFTKQQQMLVNNKLSQVIRDIFPEEWQLYILDFEREKLCIIINFPEKEMYSEVIRYFKILHDTFEKEREYLHLLTGIGGACRSLINKRL